jgi:alpha-L-fucosidase
MNPAIVHHLSVAALAIALGACSVDAPDPGGGRSGATAGASGAQQGSGNGGTSGTPGAGGAASGAGGGIDSGGGGAAGQGGSGVDAGGMDASFGGDARDGGIGPADGGPADRLAWWREAKFGMFVHWGLYAVLAGSYNGQQVSGIGEWIMHDAKIPVADYAAVAQRFNPTGFDANEWVRIAKGAGMKYIVITSKHHDGFAMFRSAVNPFNIYDATPFKRDPLRELSDACKREGIHLGFYYSQAQDWHQPGGAKAGGAWDAAQNGDMGQYISTIAVPHVKELLTNYGDVAVVWWDTPIDMTAQLAAPLSSALTLQSTVITNNRLGGGYQGDYQTPEQTIPGAAITTPWETCMTMNDTWGYKAQDNNWKSTQTLVRNLVDIVSKGGNYLLNVGPTGEGIIPAPSVDRLQQIGTWMAANGEALYGASASPFKPLSWGRATTKKGRLFLHVFDVPAGGQILVPMQNTPSRVYPLASPGTLLTSTAGAAGVTIQLPTTAPDPYATVYVAELDADVVPITGVVQGADGSITLKAADATIVGSTAQLEGTGEQNVGYWTNVGDYLTWEVKVSTPGRFSVALTYACDPGSAGSTFSLVNGASSLDGQTQSTGSWSAYVTTALGSITVAQAGAITFQLKPKTKPGVAVMNFRTLALKPMP